MTSRFRTYKSKLVKLGRYGFWSAMDQVVLLGITQLALFPLLGMLLPKKTFGIFVIGIALLNMIGLAPSTGLHGFYIREAVKYDSLQKANLLRLLLIISIFATLPFALLLILGRSYISVTYQEPLLAGFLPFLGLSLILYNTAETCMVSLRAQRKFHTIFFIHLLYSLLLFTAVPLYFGGGFQLIGLGYVISATGFLAAAVFALRQEIIGQCHFTRQTIIQVLKIWWPLTLSSILFLSAGRLDRLLLGYWWEEEIVSNFFVAFSIGTLIITPSLLSSYLLFSLLGGVDKIGFWNREKYLIYFLVVVLFSLTLLGLGWILGPFAISILYPKYALTATPLLTYILLGLTGDSIRNMLRPFIMKFFHVNSLPVLTALELICRFVPAVVLIPSRGAMGAALGLLIGLTITSLLWTAVYFYAFIIRSQAATVPSHSSR